MCPYTLSVHYVTLIMTLSYSTPSLRPDTLLVCPFPFRCGSTDGGRHSHRFHCGNLLRADRSDLSHPSHDGRRHPGQHGSAGSATVTVRLHHPGQEAALSPRAGLRPHKVRRHCKYQCRGSTYVTKQLGSQCSQVPSPSHADSTSKSL